MTEWLTRKQAAEYLQVTPRTIDRWMAKGRLRYHRIAGSGRRRIRREDLDAMLVPGEAGAEGAPDEGEGQYRLRRS